MSILLEGLTSYNLVTGGMGGDTPVAAARPDVPVKITVSYNNLIDTAQLITTDQQPGLPVDNLKLQQRKKPYASLVKSSAPFTVEVEIILADPSFFTLMALVEFNLPYDAQIRLRANSERSYAAAPFDETFTAREALLGFGEGGFGWGGLGGFQPDITGMLQPIRPHFLGYDSNGQTPYYQNLLLSITVNTLDEITYTSIGRLWLADHLEFYRNYTYGAEFKAVDPSQLDESLRVERAEEIYLDGNLRVAHLPGEDFNYQIRDFLYTVGRKRDFILMLNPSSAEGRYNESYYCRAVDPVPWAVNPVNNKTISMHIREEVE